MKIISPQNKRAALTLTATYWFDKAWSGVPEGTQAENLPPARKFALARAQWYDQQAGKIRIVEPDDLYTVLYHTWRRNGKTFAVFQDIMSGLEWGENHA